jgi:hypothetical protein
LFEKTAARRALRWVHGLSTFRMPPVYASFWMAELRYFCLTLCNERVKYPIILGHF